MYTIPLVNRNAILILYRFPIVNFALISTINYLLNSHELVICSVGNIHQFLSSAKAGNNMERLLYCVSPKGEEFIASVQLKCDAINISTLPEKIVVTDYSKDSSIWKTFDLKAAVKLTCLEGSNVKAFSTFSNYLLQRQKAGVVELENKSVLYIFPPSSSDNNSLICHLKSPMVSVAQVGSGFSGSSAKLPNTVVSNSKLGSLLSKVSLFCILYINIF